MDVATEARARVFTRECALRRWGFDGPVPEHVLIEGSMYPVLHQASIDIPTIDAAMERARTADAAFSVVVAAKAGPAAARVAERCGVLLALVPGLNAEVLGMNDIAYAARARGPVVRPKVRPLVKRPPMSLLARIQRMSVQELEHHFGLVGIDALDDIHNELQAFIGRTPGCLTIDQAVARFKQSQRSAECGTG